MREALASFSRTNVPKLEFNSYILQWILKFMHDIKYLENNGTMVCWGDAGSCRIFSINSSAAASCNRGPVRCYKESVPSFVGGII